MAVEYWLREWVDRAIGTFKIPVEFPRERIVWNKNARASPTGISIGVICI